MNINDYISQLGYSEGSPFAGNPYLNIQGNNITMANTPQDLYLQPMKKGKKKGKAVLAKANSQNPYIFPDADSVQETPIMQEGGYTLEDPRKLVNKNQSDSKTKDYYTANGLKTYEPTTFIGQGSKSTPMSEKIRTLKNKASMVGQPNVQIDAQGNTSRINQNRGYKGNAENFMSETEDKAGNHAIGALEAASIIMPAGELVGQGLKAAGKYLTEQTALKNAYKLNPKAFIPNPEAYYRGIGKAGYKDALESNTLRVNQNPQWDDAFGRKFDPSTQSPYFFKGNNFEGVKAYNSDVIAELTDHEMKSRTFSNVANFGKVEGDVGYIPPVYQPAKQVGSLGKFKVIEKVNQVPVGENTRFLKKDWWQGYKEVPKNTSGDVWWNGKGYQSTPLNNPTIQPKKKLQEIIEEARTLYHNNGVESLSERQKALIEFHGEKEGSNYITAAKKEQNLKDLEYAKQYYQKFGYDIPNNLKEIANSSVTTDNIIKDLVNQHNTFVRGVSTNWKELEARNPEILRHLEGKGIDWKNNPKAAAEYMATHIPIQTGYGRASLNSNIFNKGMDGLYTSNSVKTAEGYTYGDGFVVKAKRPTDFSSPNRQDWLNKNKLDYYEHDIPRALTKEDLEAQKGWLSSNMRETFNEKTLGNKENADKVNKWLDEVSAKDIELRKKYGIAPQGRGDYAMIGVKGDHPEFDMLRKQKLEDVKKYHEEYNTLYNNSKNEVWKTLKPTTGTLNKNLLKTEHTSFGKIGNMFGQYGNTSFDVLNMLEPISANVVKHDVQLSNIVKEIGKKYNPNILKKIEELSDLGVKMNKSPKQIKRVTELEAEITSVKQASQQEVLDAHKAYLTRHYPGWENMENKYAHYIHLGTPGEKVLEPIESIRITPEIWKNKSRAHTNTYSKGLSAGVTTGVVAGAAALQQKKEGGWLQKYQTGDTFESLTGIKPLKNVKQQSEVQPTGITTPELKSYKNTTSFNQGKKISLQQQKINQKKKEAYALANGYTMNNGEIEMPLPLSPGQQRFNKGLEQFATAAEIAGLATGAGELYSGAKSLLKNKIKQKATQEVISTSSGMDAVYAKQPGYNSHLFKKQGYVSPTTDPKLMARLRHNPEIDESLRQLPNVNDYNFINMGENPIKGQGYTVESENYVGGLSNPKWRKDAGNTVGKWLFENKMTKKDNLNILLNKLNTQKYGGNIYQKGGMTASQIYSYLFGDDRDDKEDTPPVTAPSTEELPQQEQDQQPQDDEQARMAMEQAMDGSNPYQDTPKEFNPYQGNPYQGNVETKDKAQYAYEFYQRIGLPGHIAAGIVGNAIQESGNFRDDVIRGERKGDSGLATGIWQMHKERWQGYLNWAEANGKNPYTLDPQLEYALIEPGEGKKALNALSKTSTPEEAANVFAKVFERPKIIDPNRAMHARNLHPYRDGGIYNEILNII